MLAYTPYAEWQKPLNRFDVRRQNLYAQEVLRLAEPVLQIIPLLGVQKTAAQAGCAQRTDLHFPLILTQRSN